MDSDDIGPRLAAKLMGIAGAFEASGREVPKEMHDAIKFAMRYSADGDSKTKQDTKRRTFGRLMDDALVFYYPSSRIFPPPPDATPESATAQPTDTPPQIPGHAQARTSYGRRCSARETLVISTPLVQTQRVWQRGDNNWRNFARGFRGEVGC